MWVLLFVFDVFVCGCFFGGLFFERCPSFLLFPRGEKRSTFPTIITISTDDNIQLLFPVFGEERERERERFRENTREKKRKRERR